MAARICPSTVYRIFQITRPRWVSEEEEDVLSDLGMGNMGIDLK